MKKSLCILIIIFALFNVCSCNLLGLSDVSINDRVMEVCLIEVDAWGYEDGRSFSVVNRGNGNYSVDINGKWIETYIGNRDKIKAVKTNITECTDRETELFEYAKEAVILYIDETVFFENKDSLMEYISSLSIKSADFSYDYDIEYDEECKAVVINKKYEALCGERITYALICALMHKTREMTNVDENYDLIDTAAASIIAQQVYECNEYNCYEVCESNDFTFDYSGYIYLYLGCAGDQGIKACFYGYDDIFQIIPKDELDVYHACLDDIEQSEDAIIIICNCINQWIIEKEARTPTDF